MIVALSVTGVRNDLHSIHFQEIGYVLKKSSARLISEQIAYTKVYK